MARGKIDLSGVIQRSVDRAESGEGRGFYEKALLTPPTPPTPPGGDESGLQAETGFGRRAIHAEGPRDFSLKRAEAAGTVMYPAPQESPTRPRVQRAAYDAESEVLRLQFRDGTEWEYFGVSRRDWGRYKRYKSSNRFIENVANAFPYSEAAEYVWS